MSKFVLLVALIVLVGLLNMPPQALSPPPIYDLTIAATRGGATDPELGTHTYINGTVVNVTAIPDLGFSFDYWLLDGKEIVENPTAIIMNANHALKAFFVDNIPPEIGVPTQEPPNNVAAYQNVTVTVNVTDLGTGVHNVTLLYSIDNGTRWFYQDMTQNEADTYRGTIPGYENGTRVTYKIVAYDNQGKQAINDNNGDYFRYDVLSEIKGEPIIPNTLIFGAIIVATALVITAILFASKKRHRKFRHEMTSYLCESFLN